MNPENVQYSHCETPLGPLLLVSNENGLCIINFPLDGAPVQAQPHWHKNDAALQAAKDQLTEYFQGRRQQFDLQLAPQATPFQACVLEQLEQINYAETRSYGQLATALNKPKAARAVGTACGRNPLPIVIPCHRVVGSNGSLTGFAGGLAAKRWLLDHEKNHA